MPVYNILFYMHNSKLKLHQTLQTTLEVSM